MAINSKYKKPDLPQRRQDFHKSKYVRDKKPEDEDAQVNGQRFRMSVLSPFMYHANEKSKVEVTKNGVPKFNGDLNQLDSFLKMARNYLNSRQDKDKAQAMYDIVINLSHETRTYIEKNARNDNDLYDPRSGLSLLSTTLKAKLLPTHEDAAIVLAKEIQKHDSSVFRLSAGVDGFLSHPQSERAEHLVEVGAGVSDPVEGEKEVVAVQRKTQRTRET